MILNNLQIQLKNQILTNTYILLFLFNLVFSSLSKHFFSDIFFIIELLSYSKKYIFCPETGNDLNLFQITAWGVKCSEYIEI